MNQQRQKNLYLEGLKAFLVNKQILHHHKTQEIKINTNLRKKRVILGKTLEKIIKLYQKVIKLRKRVKLKKVMIIIIPPKRLLFIDMPIHN
jgi:hypothetical protein